MTTLLEAMETAEFRAVEELRRLAPHSRRAVQLRELLSRARTAKAALLAGGDTLRKLGLRGVEFGRTATADGRPLDPREIRKSEEAPLEVIKRALRASAAEGDQAFLRWYGQRAGQ